MLQGLNEAAITELEELRAEGSGMLRPEAVLERARTPNSALHKYFEWDDSEAGAAYRLQQARQVIRAVVRLPTPSSVTAAPVRAYISLPSDRASGAGYRAIQDVADDDRLAAEALRELKRVVMRMQMRYGAIARISLTIARIAEIVETTDVGA